MYDAVEFEKRGVPCVEIVSDAFETEARSRAAGQGLASFASIAIPAEVSYADLPTVQAMADEAMPKIVHALTQQVEAVERRSAEPKTIQIKSNPGEDILEAWYRYTEEHRWTDGFLLTPPTEERVKWMLTGTNRSPDEVIAVLPPLYGKATVEKIAINAVMAGAKPEYLEVIIAAVAAVADPKVYLEGTTTTTDPGNAPLIVINGPIVNELGLNSSWGVMGPGWRSNSTIGRALSLCIRNIGGADSPGQVVQHVYYLPNDYSFVLAQPYPETPGNWRLLSEQLGYRRDQNVVFVMPSDGPINICPFDSPTQPISAEGLLINFVDEIARNAPKKTGIIMFAPEHVRILSAEGWTAEEVKSYILTTGFNPAITAARANGFTGRGPTVKPRTYGLTRLARKALVEDPVVSGEDPVRDVFIVVAGAPYGGHGCVIPMASHGGWAAREVGTLAPPPSMTPTLAPTRVPATPPAVTSTPTPTPQGTTGEYEIIETKCGD